MPDLLENLVGRIGLLGGQLIVGAGGVTIYFPSTPFHEKFGFTREVRSFPMGFSPITIDTFITEWSNMMNEAQSITKKEVEEYLRNKLKTDIEWVKKALLKVFENQTLAEVATEHTIIHNNIGFTGFDAKLMTSFAKQLKDRGFLSRRQIEVLHKVMPKYWKQIMKICDGYKLCKGVLKARPSRQLSMQLV